MKIKCPRCQFENPDNTLYCGKCAMPLTATEEIPISKTETLEAPTEELTIGTIFARRFQVIEELGKGGMGKVYKGLDVEIKERVALKVLKPEIATDEKTIERFRNELKFARKISHRNVCRMYDLNKEKGTHFITMEYVPGEDLKSTIRRVGPLSTGKAVIIAKQVCEGLAEAHRLGVIHRDLKPQNIMIDSEGNAKIMDFGIARSLKADGITGTGVMIGTPNYMSPEQVEGKGADQRSDIYSLGVVLFEMITGRTPFEGDTALSIALKHKTELPPDPREINAQVPSDLSRVILKCLEKNKEKRYQNTEELLSELDKVEKGIPTTDRLLPKKKPKTRAERRRFKSFLIPGTIILAALIIVGGYFIFSRFMPTEKKEKEEKMAEIPEQTAQKPAAAAPQYGYIEIHSAPEGAEVYLDDKLEGTTPLKHELLPGTYRIRIIKSPEYEEITDVLEVKAGETSSKNYPLPPLPRAPVTKAPITRTPVYTLKINTIPEGADVRIDGNYKGKTPVQLDLSKNKCQLKVEKGEEWSTIDETLSLKPGINSVHRDLKRIKFRLSIKTNPPEARVLIGEKEFGITPVNKLVSIGDCDVKIEKQGYQTIRESITIDSDIAKTYDLSKLEKGKIRLKVHPYADVLIDGKLIGEVPPIRIQEIEEGKHTIEFVSSRLNKKFTVEVEIKAGESKEIRMNMETGESKVVKLKNEENEDG